MISRDHLATWLGVSEGRVSQMTHSLVKTWGLLERRGKRGEVRYTLSTEGIRYVTHRDRAELPTTRGIWSTELTTDKEGRRRHVGHRIAGLLPRIQRPLRLQEDQGAGRGEGALYPGG